MTPARFLSLVLAFFLGFLSCIGAIFGVGYYAYSRVSLDKLEEWGVVSVDEGQYIDEDAEVDLTAMTVKSFIEEIRRLQSLSEPVTLNLLNSRARIIARRKEFFTVDSRRRKDASFAVD